MCFRIPPSVIDESATVDPSARAPRSRVFHSSVDRCQSRKPINVSISLAVIGGSGRPNSSKYCTRRWYRLVKRLRCGCYSPALQVGDHTTGDTHDVSRRSTEVVVPRSRCSPHFVVLQQVRVHEHTQLSAVTKRRHATFVFGNLMRRVQRQSSLPIVFSLDLGNFHAEVLVEVRATKLLCFSVLAMLMPLSD